VLFIRGARETVEDIWQATYDWNEILWAGHQVHDAIFGQFVRREPSYESVHRLKTALKNVVYNAILLLYLSHKSHASVLPDHDAYANP
jgi:hypothetical protein